ncbi:serine/threonine-protein phosphatase 6 regulatory subunit 2 isoform X1 [Scophthalmus maximus]|uniref:serine/threonine-protein phosphatase 6 regulatory subunit 2 isoform X1 n=1 Tax=Scophthalmus maximus TaxID=52904 RepID=UPI0015E063B5|nr:serine/threonine-protein phosphatase 6 regulatory subunit 2 isoform X1 [Scophthalmus maximus]XP_035497526.1 serine/threonine-protein phosphatase 6 regulatory subunit 2 isoform X1 [Scophthalmus maximus]XP_035497527.1 serine/threonine-protein phosphatase 6 regulatory subunit 2 isoform X1 [Scophthalmus maximus]XP_035497528.1 serine/threonine-protein phosphatase 6 regulatory subunit 2 isoform X1 [Scophthalmus maximus]
MFWKFDLHTSSHLEALLDKEDVTLAELMDEEDVLQECKAQNRRLVLFLCQDQCMQELVCMITTEPPAGVEETRRFKYPNIACELLTCDVGVINDKLGNEESLLETLYAFLEQPSPLNPLLASFFSKTIGNLISRKTEQVISFLQTKEGFLSLVLKHIDTSAMMDVLLRLISCVEPPSLRLETLTWLNEEKLAQRLIELIHPERDEEVGRQSNASQTLCDIIRLSRDQANQLQEISQPDPLLTVLESQECVEQLLKNMFSGERTESCIVNGIQVLLTLLEIRRPVVDGVMDAQGFERSYTVNSSILLAIEPHLIHFQQLLLEPPKRHPMLTTLGVLEEPLGNTRLHVARLVASLLYTSSASHAVVAQELCRLNTMDLLLDLFFKYTWNNFLHLQVELCVAAILRPCAHEMRLQPGIGSQDKFRPYEEASTEQASTETPSSEPTVTPENSAHNLMVTHLFQHCHLVQRILEAWEENDKIQSEGGMRRGYMGHLTRIANTVVHNLEKGPVHAQISSLITELPDDYRGRWETFVDHTLSETNRKNTIDLVGAGNPRPCSEDDMESPFPKELTLQQAFSDYQIQQMTANFVDQFGFNDEEFTDHDDSIGATFDRIAEININIDSGQDSANAAVFEACSKERIQPFDDDEEDIWEEKEINYATQTKSRNRFGGSQPSLSQSASKACDRTATSGTELPDKAADSHSEETEEPKDDLDPFSSQGQTEAAKSTGWIADFGEVNSKAPAAGVGFAAWDTPLSQPAATDAEEKGWAKFTDFQPFCCSETGPRCSSPVDSELSGSDGTKPNQNPCVWSVCVARKAPLVASDSSSSSSSGSDEEEGKTASTSSETVTTETITTGAGKETIRLTMDAKNERAVFSRVFRPAVRREAAKVPTEGLSIKDTGKGNEKESEKGAKHGDCPNPTTAGPSNQPAAVTQETQPSANGPA